MRPSGTSAARAAAKPAAERGRVIDFTIGEFALGTSDLVTDAAIAAVKGGKTRYTDTIGLPELRLAIAEQFSRDTGQEWTADEVAVTAGAKPGLFYLTFILLDPGDEVIIPQPYWQTYPAQIRLGGALPVHIQHTADGQMDIGSISEAVTERTRAIIVNTPNNPTGVVYDESHLRAVAEIAIKHNLWIIFDQCYRSFVYPPYQHHHLVSLIPEVRERTIIIDSFSKTLAIAGWRVGYMLAPPNIIASVRALQSHITSCPNVISQYAVLEHLRSDDGQFHRWAMGQLEINREAGLGMLQRLRDVPRPHAQGGFYFYLDVRELLGRRHVARTIDTVDDLAAYLIQEAGTATVSGSAFGDKHGLRIFYGVSGEDLREGLPQLVAALNALR
ncbi:aminotransferase class I/II-fold pyridoxal phosphate-dependent enzyme (plasmid) [Rhizobium sp. 007]|nr:aminotransferase class I/II-fold pyridoxal phosphate-dependent enzyme [Rhizobium sp. 007]